MDLELALPGDSPFGNVGRPLTLFEGYKEWAAGDDAKALNEAAHSTSDFATYLGGVLRKRFYDVFKARTTDWTKYAQKVNLNDFRSTDAAVGLTEFSDLLEVAEEGEYKYGTLGERSGPTVRLRTYGRLMQMTRQLLINDDMGLLQRVPTAMARAARRTLQDDVLSVLIDNPDAHDGNPLFSVAHGNTGTAALSEAALEAAILAVMTQTNEDGKPLAVDMNSLTLTVPTSLMFTARRILQSTEINQTTAGAGTKNVLNDIVTLDVEPLLPDQTDWFIFSSIEDSDAKPIVLGLLNGNETPALMQKTTVQMLGSGAFDPYNLEVDSIDYKVRHDWGVSAGEWRVAYKSVVAGG
jgi:hypothetical protein